MPTEIVHISDVSGTKRVKVCDGTPNVDSVKLSAGGAKELCEKCRQAFLARTK